MAIKQTNHLTISAIGNYRHEHETSNPSRNRGPNYLPGHTGVAGWPDNDGDAVNIGTRSATMFWLLFVALSAGLFWVAGQVEAQAVFTPTKSEIGFWQFIGILLTPGSFSVLLTVILVRYLRSMYLADHGEPAKMLRVFWWANIGGCVIQVAAQAALQNTISYLTGMPIQYELFLLALFTGLLSMLAYEVIRWICIWRWNATKKRLWKAINEWIEVKPKAAVPEGNYFDPTTVGRPSDENKTEPRV